MVKGYASMFTGTYNSYANPEYSVGEYWDGNLSAVKNWIDGTKVGGTVQSAAFDFPFRYTIRDAVNNSNWTNLGGSNKGLCMEANYRRYSVTFIENHDTDRFLGNGKDTLALKQALALLLIVNRTPQLYYGTEVLMNGTKNVTDGNVRKDYPGGFPGDTHNCFTKEGRSKSEQAMFSWLSRLLHWRQGNEVVTKGKQIQFIPYNGIYVIARQYKGKTALAVLNGTSKPATLDVTRYAEVIGSVTRAKDILTNRYYDLSTNVELKPRQSLILEY
jgi:glycosidase